MIVQICCFIYGFLSDNKRGTKQNPFYEEAWSLRSMGPEPPGPSGQGVSVLHTPKAPAPGIHGRCSRNVC